MSEPCEQCAHEPSYKAVERQQQPYRGLWGAIITRIGDMSPDLPVYQRDLNRWAAEIWDEQPDAKAAFALNTTRYGREHEGHGA